MTRILIALLLISSLGLAQTRTDMTLETSQTVTGTKTFSAVAVKSLNNIKFADQYASIQAAITDAGNNGSVFVPTGAYSISSTISLSGVTSFRLVLSPGAILTAAAGLGANPILQVTGASSDVYISGGQFDGNSIATNCIRVVNAGAVNLKRVDISGTVCHGTVSDGIATTHDGSNYYYVQDVFVHHNYVYSTAQHGISARAVRNFNVTDNRVETPGSTIYGCIRIQAIGAVVKGNILSGFGTADVHANGIQGFATSQYTISGNVIVGGTASGNTSIPIYMDTSFNGVIGGNNIYGGGTGIRCEVCKGSGINANTVSDTALHGIYVNSRVDSLQKNALDATTSINASANVTLATDAGDKQEGANSLQATVAAGFTTGTVFYQDFGSNQDWGTYPIVRLWVKSDTTLNRGVLQLKLAGDTGLATVHTTIDLPSIQAATWYRIELYDQEFYPKFAVVRSWGISAASDPGAVVLHFDDLLIDVPNGPANIAGNVVSKTQSNGIFVDDMKNFAVSGNTIEDAGYNSTGNGIGVLLQADGAGTVLQTGKVNDNIIRTTINLGASSVGLKIRQANSGTIDELRINDNDISQNFNAGNQINFLGTATNVMRAGNVIATAQAGSFQLGSITFANLGTPADGSIIFCSNCTIANPCASGGTGAFAKRLNSTWICN